MKAGAAIFLLSVSSLGAAQALTGEWGGDHVSLQFTATGAGVEFDCAHGEILKTIAPDRNGRFDVEGTYTEEHGGPVRAGERPAIRKVRYAGRVTEGRMTLTVTRADTKARLGTFTLERGQEPTLMKCR